MLATCSSILLVDGTRRKAFNPFTPFWFQFAIHVNSSDMNPICTSNSTEFAGPTLLIPIYNTIFCCLIRQYTVISFHSSFSCESRFNSYIHRARDRSAFSLAVVILHAGRFLKTQVTRHGRWTSTHASKTRANHWKVERYTVPNVHLTFHMRNLGRVFFASN